MLSLIKSKRFLMALLMGIFGFAVGLIYNVVPLFQFTLEDLNYIWQEKSAELLPMFVVSGSICCIITFFAYYIGDSLKESLNLTFEKINRKSLIIILSLSFILPILVGLIDISLSNPNSFSFVSVFYTMLNTTVGVLYNAVLEEVWFRMCFISLMILVFDKVFNKNGNKIDKKYIVIGAVIFSALFLFAFQINNLLNQYVFTFMLLVRALLVYLLPNLLYGMVYIKHGIKWSVFTHIIFIIVHLGIMPFVVTLI